MNKIITQVDPQQPTAKCRETPLQRAIRAKQQPCIDAIMRCLGIHEPARVRQLVKRTTQDIQRRAARSLKQGAHKKAKKKKKKKKKVASRACKKVWS